MLAKIALIAYKEDICCCVVCDSFVVTEGRVIRARMVIIRAAGTWWLATTHIHRMLFMSRPLPATPYDIRPLVCLEEHLDSGVSLLSLAPLNSPIPCARQVPALSPRGVGGTSILNGPRTESGLINVT